MSGIDLPGAPEMTLSATLLACPRNRSSETSGGTARRNSRGSVLIRIRAKSGSLRRIHPATRSHPYGCSSPNALQAVPARNRSRFVDSSSRPTHGARRLRDRGSSKRSRWSAAPAPTASRSRPTAGARAPARG